MGPSRVPISQAHVVLLVGAPPPPQGRDWHPLAWECGRCLVLRAPLDDPFCVPDAHAAAALPEGARAAVARVHATLSKCYPELRFSTRDAEECAARVLRRDPAQASGPAVDLTALAGAVAEDVYAGYLAPPQREALQVVCGPWEPSPNPEWGPFRRRLEWLCGAERFVLTDAALEVAQALHGALLMREARAKGLPVLHGKRGMILEGPSGTGKDVLLGLVLRCAGYERVARAADPADAGPFTFLHITASIGTGYTETQEAVARAHAAGAILVISELNLLGPDALAAVLAGAFSTTPAPDVAAARADPARTRGGGFFLFATVNPADTHRGRTFLAPALGDRVLLRRVPGYSEADLRRICDAQAPPPWVPVAALVRGHVRVAGMLAARGRATQPTVRKLLHILRDLQGADRPGDGHVESRVQEVWEQQYLLQSLVLQQPLPELVSPATDPPTDLQPPATAHTPLGPDSPPPATFYAAAAPDHDPAAPAHAAALAQALLLLCTGRALPQPLRALPEREPGCVPGATAVHDACLCAGRTVFRSPPDTAGAGLGRVLEYYRVRACLARHFPGMLRYLLPGAFLSNPSDTLCATTRNALQPFETAASSTEAACDAASAAAVPAPGSPSAATSAEGGLEGLQDLCHTLPLQDVASCLIYLGAALHDMQPDKGTLLERLVHFVRTSGVLQYIAQVMGCASGPWALGWGYGTPGLCLSTVNAVRPWHISGGYGSLVSGHHEAAFRMPFPTNQAIPAQCM